MKKIVYLFLLIYTFSACNKAVTEDSDTEKDYIFTVATDIDHAIKDNTDNYFIKGCDYYGDQNYIVDDSGHIFYYTYKRIPKWICTPDTTKTSIRPPEFINLLPFQISRLPDDVAESFTKANLPSKATQRYVVVASAMDSFKSAPIFKVLSLQDDNDICIIRRMTEEERVVLDHKKSGMPYDPKEINWNPANIDITTLPVQ